MIDVLNSFSFLFFSLSFFICTDFYECFFFPIKRLSQCVHPQSLTTTNFFFLQFKCFFMYKLIIYANIIFLSFNSLIFLFVCHLICKQILSWIQFYFLSNICKIISFTFIYSIFFLFICFCFKKRTKFIIKCIKIRSESK